tara:strand:+ start:537 stop:1136 length:600 start_codon:yes stop_codon:yes gene_type:complete
MKLLLERIKELRIKNGFSQSEIAARLDIKQSNYGKLERGENQFTIDKLYKLAELFEVPIFVLFYSPERDGDIVNKEYYENISHLERTNQSLNTLLQIERASNKGILNSVSNYNKLLDTISIEVPIIKDIIEVILTDLSNEKSIDLKKKIDSVKSLLKILVGLTGILEKIIKDSKEIEEAYRNSLDEKEESAENLNLSFR